MTYCGLDCCKKCEKKKECGGCKKCDGKPFGGNCVAANIVKEKGNQGLEEFKKDLIKEINDQKIVKVKDLFLLNGFFVNLKYPLTNKKKIALLNNNDIYYGCQIEKNGYCYGVIGNRDFIIISKYEEMGKNPELLLYRKRK